MSTNITRQEVAQTLRGSEQLLFSLSRMGLATRVIAQLRRVQEKVRGRENPRRRMPSTLRELLDRSEAEMLMLTFFGRGTLRSLKELLEAYGLELNWGGAQADCYIALYDPQQTDDGPPDDPCPAGGTHAWKFKDTCYQCEGCGTIWD